MSPRRRKPFWADLPHEELLELRLCDLDLRIEGTELVDRVDRLHAELEDRGIRLKPHVWLSNEWFSPDGVPGVAVPFYLAHERLKKLEKRMMLEVEGGTERDCMKLLRHEAGHAICTAYRLHYKRDWRRRFGPMTKPYPEHYLPKAHSKNYVLHLDWWYAQAHPAEDFAETFAVWLKPNSRWRQQYRGWPALLKLRFVDGLMKSIAGEVPPVRSRRHEEPVKSLRMTLGEYYEQKRQRYGAEVPEFYDRDLRRLFSDDARYGHRPTAASFLRRARPEIRRVVAEWTGSYQYTIDLVVRDMIERSKRLRLRLTRSERETRNHAMIMVSVQTMNYLQRVPHRIAL